jgi:hypothetical protein
MLPFFRSRPDASWHRVGRVSDFPEVSQDEACQVTTACKAFRIPNVKGEVPTETDINLPGELKDQVMVFKYKGAVHAIDHVRLPIQPSLPYMRYIYGV